MRMWAKGAAGATLLTASFVAFGAVPALADGTNGDGSILGGNQVNAPISVPVNVSGNSVAAVGHAVAGSRGGAAVNGYRAAAWAQPHLRPPQHRRRQPDQRADHGSDQRLRQRGRGHRRVAHAAAGAARRRPVTAWAVATATRPAATASSAATR